MDPIEKFNSPHNSPIPDKELARINSSSSRTPHKNASSNFSLYTGNIWPHMDSERTSASHSFIRLCDAVLSNSVSEGYRKNMASKIITSNRTILREIN